MTSNAYDRSERVGEKPATVQQVNPLPRVAAGRHSSWESNVEDYRAWVGDDLIDEIRALSNDLRGLKICRINATMSSSCTTRNRRLCDTSRLIRNELRLLKDVVR